jgi:hypothetical protein
MVDFSIGIEADFIEGFGDELFLAPVDIPVVVFGLFILTAEEGLLNTVDKKGLEFHFRAKSSKFLQVQRVVVLLYVLSKVLRHCSFN